MLTRLLFLLFALHAVCGISQNLTSYTDYLQKFYVFDNARVQKLEHLPIVSSSTSDDYLAYVDNAGNFKVYQKGYSKQLEGVVDNYTAYKGQVVYETAGVIKAFANGQRNVLAARVVSYKAEDNITAFVDIYDRAFKVFIDTIYVLEQHADDNVVESYNIAPNTMAYVDAQQNFYYYQNKEKKTISEYFEGDYSVGENIVAYEDNYDYTFQTYYKGESIELDSQFPSHFKMGRNMVAWVAQDGTFSVFYDGEITELASYAPSTYQLKDDMLVYRQNGYLYLFYKGKIIEVEPFLPTTYYLDNQTLVYLDQQGYIKAYIDGNFVEITRQPNEDLKLHGNTIFYTVNSNEPRVWFNGEELEF
ncbi:hypothetical protein N9R81_05875 [Flavobacteriales bacterium]|nr:hypothetical protein [Flavobacteriales bacterium]